MEPQDKKPKKREKRMRQIGSEEVVRIRRLNLVINDIGQKRYTITSGSKGEGLDLKGSDLDVMIIDRHIKVYESETEESFNRHRQSLQQLQQAQKTITKCETIIVPTCLNTIIMCGIAHQLMGDTYYARTAFQEAARPDKYNLSSASLRLSSLI
ncbi:unnamed protein product [Mytilus edulis]|uniref:Uncharacterized protein n=1 Tax=Mytilus edulis TaxID=6550 RepID=A0A8S3ST00_MYTED|nr:unnamed protein product [Mytilus edulis]